jgi:hypothetical protein
LQAVSTGGEDVFISELNATGTRLVYSTYLGGTGFDFPSGISVDSVGSAYVCGSTYSADFPTVVALQPTYAGNVDVFVSKLTAAGNALLFSTYLGGSSQRGQDLCSDIKVDSSGSVYITGYTPGDFPTANALQPTAAGAYDAFVAKIAFDTVLPDEIAIDIKPGDAANTINLKSGGVVSAAILGSATFDPLTVDPETVTLAGARVATRGRGVPMTSARDVNRDGYPDLLLFFRARDLQLTPASTEAVLYGETFSGQRIRGADSVRIVPPAVSAKPIPNRSFERRKGPLPSRLPRPF